MEYLQAKELFLLNISSYCAEATVEYYVLNLSFFEDFLIKTYGSIDLNINDLKKTDFVSYITSCRQRGVKNTSVRTYARAIKAFFRFCYNEGYMYENITWNVKYPKPDKYQVIPLTGERVNILYEAMDSTLCSLRNKAVFSLMLDCGLRLGEVIALNRSDIDYKNSCVRIINSKNNKSRIVPLPLKVEQFIKCYLSTRNDVHCALFLDKNGYGRITKYGIQKFMSKLKKIDGDVHCHLLRHTFATSFIMGGGQLEILRVLLGHEDYAVTKGYIHLATQLGVINYDIYRLDGIMFSRYIAYTPTTGDGTNL